MVGKVSIRIPTMSAPYVWTMGCRGFRVRRDSSSVKSAVQGARPCAFCSRVLPASGLRRWILVHSSVFRAPNQQLTLLLRLPS